MFLSVASQSVERFARHKSVMCKCCGTRAPRPGVYDHHCEGSSVSPLALFRNMPSQSATMAVFLALKAQDDDTLAEIDAGFLTANTTN